MAQLMVGAIIHILEDVYRLIYVQPDALCFMPDEYNKINFELF